MTTQSANQTDVQQPPLVPYTNVQYQPVPYNPLDAGLIEKALTVGDVSKMPPDVRVQFYRALCASCGLNPLTRPFILLKTRPTEQSPSGELVWYCTVGACEQLRRLHHVSTKIISREFLDAELYAVLVEVSTPDGRREEAQAVVAMGNLKGVERANALMRCESKAKRRGTLAIVGLGMSESDESGAVVQFDAQSGEIQLPPEPADEAATLLATVGRWFRTHPKERREAMSQGIWDCPLREVPHLSFADLSRGWSVIDQGLAPIDWASAALPDDLALWRQRHASQAIIDVFGEPPPLP